VSRVFKYLTGLYIASLLGLCLQACGFLGDDDDTCTARYHLRFIDDKNLSFADAFDHEVEDLTLYVFDEEGTLVTTLSEEGDALHPAETTYAMDLSQLPPGEYHLVAWGGLTGESTFSVPTMAEGESPLEQLTCRLHRVSRSDSRSVSETDLTYLFHGMTDITIPEQDTPGDHYFQMQLTRNTKNVTVVLQQLGAGSLNADDFEFFITANNGHLNYDNSLLYDEPTFYYEAWETRTLDAGEDSFLASGDSTLVVSTTAAIVARMTTSRFVVTDRNTEAAPMLCVQNRQTGATVLAIPFIDYALMVRSYYKNITDDQDYLDRQHDYNITFFLRNGEWLNSEVIINSWRFSLVESELQ
jgi:hypothetical protein